MNVAFWKRKKKLPKEGEEEEVIILPEQIEVTDVLDLHGFSRKKSPKL